MRTAHPMRHWSNGLALVIAIGMVVAIGRAAHATGDTGIELSLSRVSFSRIVQSLAREHRMNIVILRSVDATIDVIVTTPTPVEKIIADMAKSVGLSFWKDGDIYYIGDHTVEAQPARAVIDPLPTARPANPVATSAPGGIQAPRQNTTTPDPPRRTATIRKLELAHASVREMQWALGVGGVQLTDQQRRRVMGGRVRSMLEPLRPQLNNAIDEPVGRRSPWLSDTTTRLNRTGSTDARQFRPLDDVGFVGGAAGAGAGAGAGAAGARAAGASTSRLTEAPLTAFIPEGIEDIIGLIGLNALLVKADSDESIDQLEQLIKLLDQPVKQVLVEVMFVKMEVKDAFSLGVSWEFAGMPLSVISNNGGSDGNFAVRYVKGNLKAALATMLTTSSAKVVNAPRVVVQNGSGASISVTDSIPFIIVQESENVFGSTITVPEVNMQDFTQGLTVDSVIIHPDDTITLRVFPELSGIGAGIGIPGGSGEISSSTDFIVETVLRVKNGETVMMGGFVSKNETMGGTRAPLLSDLPILGPLLFRNKTHGTNNTETLVFVTPTIMKDDTTSFDGMETLPPLF